MDSKNGVGRDYQRPTEELLDLLAGADADPETRKRMQERLDEARKVDLETATVVIASWENRFAAAGGVRAVTQEYAKYLASQRRAVRVVTPLHTGLKAPPGNLRLVAVLWLDFDRARRRVEVFESEWAGVPWVFVHCEGFFNAEGGRDRSNPYLYEYDARQESLGVDGPYLVRDCLLFAAVLPKVLCALGISDNAVLHLQDWETVAGALTVKEAILRKEISRAVCVLALHNPYDKGMNPPGLSSRGWAMLTRRSEPTGTPPTFLGRMMPILDAPPATVSREFAVDLTGDPLQTTHFANHLQGHFTRFGVVGVDNGPFQAADPPFSQSAIRDAREGRPEKILAEKRDLREKMKKEMAQYRPAQRWGDVDFAELADDVPVFMCVGRLDPGQKGFDVAARAIEMLLDEDLPARFVLTPIVGNAPQPFVDDLEALGKDYGGRVVVYPFRMQRGYLQIQAGCAFSIWPSMYEPFGGVSEFLLRGTPVVARATGGLRQQIVDFDRETGEGNGVFYESPGPGAEGGDWRRIQAAANPRSRMSYPVYQDQVRQLAGAIRRAIEIFREPRDYGRLLSNVYDWVEDYSWERAAAEYASIYEIARQ